MQSSLLQRGCCGTISSHAHNLDLRLAFMPEFFHPPPPGSLAIIQRTLPRPPCVIGLSLIMLWISLLAVAPDAGTMRHSWRVSSQFT